MRVIVWEIRKVHLLALDIASRKTGWARWDTAKARPVYGVFQATEGELGQRALSFDGWLLEKIKGEEVGALVVEAPVPVTGQTTLDVLLSLHGFYVLALRQACRLSIPLTPVNLGTWRSHFIGVARAPMALQGAKTTPHWRRQWLKKKTIEACNARGWSVTSDDAADALGLLDYARSMSDPTYSLQNTPLFAEREAA